MHPDRCQEVASEERRRERREEKCPFLENSGSEEDVLQILQYMATILGKCVDYSTICVQKEIVFIYFFYSCPSGLFSSRCFGSILLHLVIFSTHTYSLTPYGCPQTCLFNSICAHFQNCASYSPEPRPLEQIVDTFNEKGKYSIIAEVLCIKSDRNIQLSTNA